MDKFLQNFLAFFLIPGSEAAQQSIAILCANCERTAVLAKFFRVELSKQWAGRALDEINCMLQTFIEVHPRPHNDHFYSNIECFQ